MSFVVRILTHDDGVDFKVFSEHTKAQDWFNAAWILICAEAVDSPFAGLTDPEKLRRVRDLIGIDSIERVELHECRPSIPSDAVAEVRNERSLVRAWRSIEEPYGDLIYSLLDLEDPED
jgi:hypothetical protein